MCGGGVPDSTPVMTHEEVNADPWRSRPNPSIHATIEAPRPMLLSTADEATRQNDLPFLLPQLDVDLNRNLPTWEK